MSAETDRLIKGLAKTIDETQTRKAVPYDTEATVRRIEGNIAWVHIPGGVDETPVQLSMNAAKGDAVKVRVSGGRAWITGNTTAPPTDDSTANVAKKAAAKAYNKADEAYEDAELAKTSAEVAREAAGAATRILGDMEEAAEAADTSLTQIFSDAKSAQESAQSAQSSADQAFEGMSLVQRVVDVANWIAKHGEYKLTQDTTVTPDKFYFRYDSAAQTYSVFTPAEGSNPKEQGLYEISRIDEAISNFVNAHMVLVDDGLILKNGNVRIDLSLKQGEEGIILYSNNKKLATYGEGTIIGDVNGFHVKVSAQELGFYNGNVKVAYLNEQKLYISQSVVLEQMDVGQQTGVPYPLEPGKIGKGQWSWKVHEIQGQNNLYLKWLG